MCVCVCVCTYVCVHLHYACTHIQMCPGPCARQVLNCNRAWHMVFWGRVLHFSIGWHGSSCLCLPSTRLSGASYHPWRNSVFSVIETMMNAVSYIKEQVFSPECPRVMWLNACDMSSLVCQPLLNRQCFPPPLEIINPISPGLYFPKSHLTWLNAAGRISRSDRSMWCASLSFCAPVVAVTWRWGFCSFLFFDFCNSLFQLLVPKVRT